MNNFADIFPQTVGYLFILWLVSFAGEQLLSLMLVHLLILPLLLPSDVFCIFLVLPFCRLPSHQRPHDLQCHQQQLKCPELKLHPEPHFLGAGLPGRRVVQECQHLWNESEVAGLQAGRRYGVKTSYQACRPTSLPCCCQDR